MANTTSNSRISSLVSSQVPFFVRNDHGNFVKFLEAYYEYLEQHTKAVNTAKSLLNYQNIDLTEDQYAQKLYATFMKFMPDDIKADKALLLKHIKDFYRAKGTEKSVRFLLNVINNVQEIDFYYPKKDVLRASDGKWFIQRSLRVDDIRINGVPTTSLEELQKFVGTRIVSSTTGTIAIVEAVDRFYEQNVLINELTLSNIDGRFRNSEVVTGTYEEDGEVKTITAVVFNFVIDKVTIINPGSGYKINDPVIINSTTGTGACVFVSSVTAGEVTGVTVLDGGAGYQVGDLVVFDGDSTGAIATGNVKAVNTDESVHPNSYLIDDSLISSEQNTVIGNTVSSQFETFAYQNLATLFVTTEPAITNLSFIATTSTTLSLNRIANRSNVAYSNNSPISINGQTSIIETSSLLSTNTVNVFPGFTANIVNLGVSFYTSKLTSNLFANSASGNSVNTISFVTRVLTPNSSNIRVVSADVGNTLTLTQWAGNSNVFFTTGYSLNINNRTVIVTSANANSAVIRTTPALFGTLTDNNVVVYEISYPSVLIGNSNVFFASGNVLSLGTTNVFVTEALASSNTAKVYPGVSGNLSLVPVDVFSSTTTSNLRVGSAYANTVRLSLGAANSNVYFGLYDQLNVNGELVTILSFVPDSNTLIISPGFNNANSTTSGIIVIRPPYNPASNLTISTGSGNLVTTATLSGVKSTSNVFFETFDSLNVNGTIVLVTSSNTVTSQIGISPGLPGNLTVSSFSVIKKPNVNTKIANSLVYFTYAETGPVTEIRIINPGGYSSPPTAQISANTKILNRGILGKMTIINGGTGYQIGDRIDITNVPGGFGFGAVANVTNVAANGMITQVKFVSTPGQVTGGTGYDQNFLPTANVFSATGTGANVAVTALLGSGASLRVTSNKIGAIQSLFIASRGAGYEDANADLTLSGDGLAVVNVTTIAGDAFGVYAYPGRYLNDDGHISSYNFLQDRDYYQTFSYVIKTPLSTVDYRQAVQELIHPAGMKMFGEYTVVDQNTESPLDANATTHQTSTIKLQTYVKTGSTVNVYYPSHGLSVGNTVYLEFTSNAAGNVENAIYSVASVITDHFTVTQKSPIANVTISNAGRNYNANSYLVFTGGSGYGANGTFTVNANGSIVSVNISNFGINYISLPTVTANGTNSVPATFSVSLRYASNTSGNVEVGKILL